MNGLHRKGMGNGEAQNTSTLLLQSFGGESIFTAKMVLETKTIFLPCLVLSLAN
jgi:hypothetical protein